MAETTAASGADRDDEATTDPGQAPAPADAAMVDQAEHAGHQAEHPEHEAGTEAAPAPGAVPDEDAALSTGSGQDWGNTPEATTEAPAITHATGPRLRRVRSLPAPPVDEEPVDEDE
jgi:hypothetical protein